MLHYAVVFFVISLIASILGFGGIAGLTAQIGWIFGILAAIFLVLAIGRRRAGGGPPSLP